MILSTSTTVPIILIESGIVINDLECSTFEFILIQIIFFEYIENSSSQQY